MTLWALGINHTTAPLDLRGRFAIAVHDLPPTLEQLQSHLGAEAEVSIVSTCNRTELYGAGSPEQMQLGLHWLAENGRVSLQELLQHAYIKEGAAAAQHMFRVASGLDSMVLGETQILGQLKDAMQAANQVATLGCTLQQLYQQAFQVAKAVRSQTDIGSHSISMSAAAVRLAGQLFDDLSNTRILFVGAGEMIELTATHFAAKRPQHMVVANRTVERGRALAQRYSDDNITTDTMRMADIPLRLAEFDIVVSCTAAPLPIIGLGAVESAIKARRRKPMFMLDLAVPRDMEAEIQKLPDIYLYTVDDLAQVVQKGQAQRQAAVSAAEALVNQGVNEFKLWQQSRNSGQVDLIQRLNQQVESWRLAELDKARRALEQGKDPYSVLEQLSRGLNKKMLHGSYSYLRSASTDELPQRQHSLEQIFLAKP